MTDREMLEAAAKAAGIVAFWDPYAGDGESDVLVTSDGYIWNPLTDDGDALRLATKLGLSLEPYPLYTEEKHSVIVKQRRRSDQLRESNPTECIERYKGDTMGATRRAIVRAAAEIGQGISQPTLAADLPEDNYYKTEAEAFGYGRAR